MRGHKICFRLEIRRKKVSLNYPQYPFLSRALDKCPGNCIVQRMAIVMAATDTVRACFGACLRPILRTCSNHVLVKRWHTDLVVPDSSPA